MNDAFDPCLRALQLMNQLLDDDLDDVMADEIRHHVYACATCTDTYDVEVVMRSTIRRCCQEQAPSSLRARIIALRFED